MYVGTSKLAGAGFGVFSKRSGKKGMLVGFYNGIKVLNIEANTMSKEGRRSQYRIDNDWAFKDQIIDIPNIYRFDLSGGPILSLNFLEHSQLYCF